ncbi:ribosome silencing factor [Chthonobacter rhizosphaerae]|uniref:ribosome silencing factor n=1 Tax=Chthonobacter rhizosphaerae TaxID=2735553 RepID=UPI0015EF3641|nr:ribosome silencing factor [Chthonobacter rhizosphaerae]
MTLSSEGAVSRAPQTSALAASSAAEPTVGAPASLLAAVLASLDNAKAEEIVAIDIAGKTPIADHMVVCSGRSHRHVGAIADHLLKDIKDAGFGTATVEGMTACDWVLIDTGDVIVHVFRPEVRQFYNLEKMWAADAAPARIHG